MLCAITYHTLVTQEVTHFYLVKVGVGPEEFLHLVVDGEAVGNGYVLGDDAREVRPGCVGALDRRTRLVPVSPKQVPESTLLVMRN